MWKKVLMSSSIRTIFIYYQRVFRGTAQIIPQKSSIPIRAHTQERPMYHLSGQHLKELLEYCQKQGLTNIVLQISLVTIQRK